MFDEITLDGREGTSKAFGKGLRTLEKGDKVALIPAAITPEELEKEAQGHKAQPVKGLDFQTHAHPGGFLIVKEGVLTDWVDEPHEALPTFDYYGHSLTLNLDKDYSYQSGMREPTYKKGQSLMSQYKPDKDEQAEQTLVQKQVGARLTQDIWERSHGDNPESAHKH